MTSVTSQDTEEVVEYRKEPYMPMVDEEWLKENHPNYMYGRQEELFEQNESSIGVYSSTLSKHTNKKGQTVRRGSPAYLQLILNGEVHHLDMTNKELLTLLKQCAEALDGD